MHDVFIGIKKNSISTIPSYLDTSEIGSRPPGGDDNRDQRGDRGSCTWKEERRREREVNLGLVENFQRDVDFFVSLATYF